MSAIDSITAINSGDNGASIPAPAIDHSYHRFNDISGPDTGVGTMSFSDLLDVINPLEHIPIVSAIYRAASGDTISPGARVAGDALYGAAMGVASMGLSLVGAVGDEVFTAANGGTSAAQMVVASLFGKSDDQSIQLADATPAQTADTQPQDMQVAAMQTPLLQSAAKQSPILDMPDLAGAATQTASVTPASAATMATPELASNTPSSTATAIESGKGLAIDRSKLAYGGVMDPAMMQNAQQNQALALALAAGQNNMQSSHALRNSRFATSSASPMTNVTAQSAGLPLPGETPSLAGIASPPAANSSPGMAASPITAQGQAQNVAVTPSQILAQSAGQSTAQSLPSGLRQSIPSGATTNLAATIKSLDQYRSTASRVPVPFVGGAVDVTN